MMSEQDTISNAGDAAAAESGETGFLWRLVDARWTLAAAAAVLAGAVLWFAVPIWAAVAGYLFLAGAAGISPRRRVFVSRRMARTDGGQSLWPDTSMKLVADAFPNPCFLIDRRGITRYANVAARDRFGSVRPGDPLSLRLRAPSLLEALDRVIAGGGEERIEWTEKVPTELWFEASIVSVRPIGAGDRPAAVPQRPGFILVTVRDLTEQRRLERMRADFVANASHELRTPLASLTGFIETLQGPARDDATARERFLQIMLEQAGRMRRLIDDLLSLSRIELKAHVHPETVVDLGSVMRHTLDGLQPLARELGVVIELDVPDQPIPVFGDRDELTEVFENLVENALKYGAAGKRVEVRIVADPAQGGPGGWLVSVKDFGPGIDPDHLPRLTERFYRVDVTASREMKGTGLGLAIVKHILTRHKARLDIESVPGKGACFTVRVPAAKLDASSS